MVLSVSIFGNDSCPRLFDCLLLFPLSFLTMWLRPLHNRPLPIRYEFNASDLDNSFNLLNQLLSEAKDGTPWPALLYITAEISYGGRVTDDQDRRCMNSILRQYYTPKIIDKDRDYKFSPSGTYFAPEDGDLQSYHNYIDSLPIFDLPEVFGMHDNANVNYQRQESVYLLETVLSIQPRETSTGAGKGPDEIVTEIADEFASQVLHLQLSFRFASCHRLL